MNSGIASELLQGRLQGIRVESLAVVLIANVFLPSSVDSGYLEGVGIVL